MQVVVYKSLRKSDTYLFVEKEDAFQAVPQELLAALGNLVKVMDLDLYPGRKLARTDADTVISALMEYGYYLQMPPLE